VIYESYYQRLSEFDFTNTSYIVTEETHTLYPCEKNEDTKQSLDTTVRKLRACCRAYQSAQVSSVHFLALSRFSSALAEYVTKKHADTPFWKQLVYGTYCNISSLKAFSRTFKTLFVRQSQRERNEVTSLQNRYSQNRSLQTLVQLGNYLKQRASDDDAAIEFFKNEALQVLQGVHSNVLVELLLYFDPTCIWLHTVVEKYPETRIKECIGHITTVSLDPVAKKYFNSIDKIFTIIAQEAPFSYRITLQAALLFHKFEEDISYRRNCTASLDTLANFLFGQIEPSLSRKICHSMLFTRIHQLLCDDAVVETRFLQNALLFFTSREPNTDSIHSLLSFGLSSNAAKKLVRVLQEIAKSTLDTLPENLNFAITVIKRFEQMSLVDESTLCLDLLQRLQLAYFIEKIVLQADICFFKKNIYKTCRSLLVNKRRFELYILSKGKVTLLNQTSTYKRVTSGISLAFDVQKPPYVIADGVNVTFCNQRLTSTREVDALLQEARLQNFFASKTTSGICPVICTHSYTKPLKNNPHVLVPKAHIIMPYGPMRAHDCTMQTYSPKIVVEAIYDFLCGLCVIHDTGYVHGDLKSTNMIVDSFFRGFLIDFGFCFQPGISLPPTVFQRGYYGSIFHTPPEMLLKKSPIDLYAAEMWAFGSVCYFMFFGKRLPWEALLEQYKDMPPSIARNDLQKILQEIDRVVTKPKKMLEQIPPRTTPEEILLCIFRMLDPDPQSRITCREALNTISTLIQRLDAFDKTMWNRATTHLLRGL